MWKECKVCNNYLISDDGEVMNKHTKKLLKQKLDKHNELNVGLSMGKRGLRKWIAVHRLVAEAYLPNPDNLPEVIHIDGNSINNEVNNLKWATSKERFTHSKSLKTIPDDSGDRSPNSKLTFSQIQYCRLMYKPKDRLYGCKALAKRFGVSKSTMSYVLNNKTYK